MAINPIGQDSYNGLCVPLDGESVIRQENSSNTIVTLMHSSVAATGRFLMGLDYIADRGSGTLTDLAVFDIDEEGGFRSVSGTTMKAELDSTGLFFGTTQVMDAGGKLLTGVQRLVTTVAVDTTGVTPTSAESGTLYVQSAGTNTTCRYYLPATPPVGCYFDVFCATTAAGDITVMSLAAGDAQGFMFYQSTGDFLTTAGATCATSGNMYHRYTALTSGSLWLVSALWYSDNSSAIDGMPVAASTTT